MIRTPAAVLTSCCVVAQVWAACNDTPLPPSVVALTGVSATVWLVCKAEQERAKAAAPASGYEVLDWCEGCDELRPRNQMGLNSIWLYRCCRCRGVDELPDVSWVQFTGGPR